MPTRKKLLVVDDDEVVFDYLQKKIGDLYDLVATTEPALAMSLALEEKPDLILCDIDMPDMRGEDLGVKFAECAKTAHIPFMYLTAIVSPEEARHLGGNIGGRPGIAKRAPAPEMIQRIEQMLR